MISCLSTWSLNKQLPFPRFPLSPFPGLSVNSGRPPWIAELLQWQSEGIVHKFPGSQWLDISSVLPAAHAGMGCRSPGNLNKMQIKAGMEGCSLRVHSSVVVKLRCRDGWGSAPRVPPHLYPPRSAWNTLASVFPAHTPADAAGLQSPVHVLSDESLSFSTRSRWTSVMAQPQRVR